MRAPTKTYPIKLYPAPILKEKTTPITEFDDSLREICTNMIASMEKSGGVGLAAPQVGIGKSIFVMQESPFVLMNPEIIETEGEFEDEEGCLSLPGVYFNIKRAEKITITYQNIEGWKHTLVIDDARKAKCVQHEIDHLNGKTMLDHCSSDLKRSLHIKKILKEKKKLQRKKI